MDLSKPTQAVRKEWIAEAVHNAICETTHSDGTCFCLYYAVTGCLLARDVFGKPYLPQAGTLILNCDSESNKVIAMEPESDGLEGGEFHCWFSLPDSGAPGTLSTASEIVDLTSRHYETYVANPLCLTESGVPTGDRERMIVAGDERPQWSLPSPPDFIWIDNGVFPDYVRLIPCENPTNALRQVMDDGDDAIRILYAAAVSHYHRLSGVKLRDRKKRRKSRPQTKSNRPGRNSPCPCGSGRKFKKCCYGSASQERVEIPRPDPAGLLCHKECHDWIVFSTAMAEGCLMLNCSECGAMGTVDDPTDEEWSAAYTCPSRPAPWTENQRVVVREHGPVYVAKQSGRHKAGKISLPSSPLSRRERVALDELETEVIQGGLDGRLFPYFIETFDEQEGFASGPAVKHLATSVKFLVDQGRLFTPAMIAIVIREYVRQSTLEFENHPQVE